MIEVRHATKVQPKGSVGTRAPEADSIVSPSLGSVLSRSGQTGRVRCNDRSACSKTMHSRDISHRVRFFLPGIPSTEKVRRLETSDRFLTAKRGKCGRPNKGIPFQVAPPQEIVFTDASSKEWGVTFKGTMWSGTWQRTSHHINWLELRAVLVAIQHLQFRLKGKTTIFMIDNATTVSYLMKQGGQDHGRYSNYR